MITGKKNLFDKIMYYVTYLIYVPFVAFGYLPLSISLLVLLIIYLDWFGRIMFLIFYLFGIFMPHFDFRYLFYAILRLKSHIHPKIIIKGLKESYSDKTILTFHPHGALIATFYYLIEFNSLRKFIPLGHELFDYLPFVNIIFKLLGVQSVKNINMKYLMSRSKPISILPGGQADMVVYRLNEHNIYLRDRKGFIKYALQYGYQILPSYSFTESALYEKISIARDLQYRWAKSKNILLNLLAQFLTINIYGKYFLIFNEVPLFMVFGEPLKFPKIANPSQSDIDKYHNIYKNALSKLFYDNINTWRNMYPKSTKDIVYY